MPKFEIKQKVTELKDKAVDLAREGGKKAKQGIRWVMDNPEKAAALGAAATAFSGGIHKVTRIISRHVALHKEQTLKDRYVYDRSLNMYLKTKRKLTRKDMDNINRQMRKTGKRKSEVMSDLHLLK